MEFILTLTVIISCFLLFTFRRPSDFKIERSASIAAPASEIFPHVNNFKEWPAWSPWAKLDPNANIVFEGSKSGVGAVFKWSGNRLIGIGQMTITESIPNELIKIDLEITKPMMAKNYVEFSFKPSEDKTLVTWTMSGKHGFMGKFVGMFTNYNKMIGKTYEQGLRNLARQVEPSPP